jgi:predicted tellurium resistance membrane protein TerC
MKELVVIILFLASFVAIGMGIYSMNFSHMQSADYLLIMVASIFVAGLIWGTIKKDDEQDSKVKPPLS